MKTCKTCGQTVGNDVKVGDWAKPSPHVSARDWLARGLDHFKGGKVMSIELVKEKEYAPYCATVDGYSVPLHYLEKARAPRKPRKNKRKSFA